MSWQKWSYPKFVPGPNLAAAYFVRDQIWQPYLVLWDRILLPDFVLGQNVAARFCPTLYIYHNYVALLHGT